MFRKTPKLKRLLGDEGISFLDHALRAIGRLLPHTDSTTWTACDGAATQITWGGEERRSLNLALVLKVGDGDAATTYGLKATLTRKKAPREGAVEKTLDQRERDLCERILTRISHVLRGAGSAAGPESLRAIRDLFDEQIVASHIQHHHDLELDVSEIFRELRKLAEQSYENNSITFGCILDPLAKAQTDEGARFPSAVLKWKKFKALSDGYRTAYRVSTNGRLLAFEDLHRFRPTSTGKHFYPEWADCIAAASTGDKCGICLTRQGDLLVFEAGTLRFTYRAGKWQYWNHAHIIDVLKNRARVQRVPPKLVGSVVNSIYRAALDVSFRRCGGMFVLLRNQRHISNTVAKGDAIGDRDRRSNKSLRAIENDFDATLPSCNIQDLSRRIMVELAGLDGAVVLNNKGRILAYGAVLQPKRKGKVGSLEGSRTKAAAGASMDGIAVKISSDGDITFFEQGEKFLVI